MSKKFAILRLIAKGLMVANVAIILPRSLAETPQTEVIQQLNNSGVHRMKEGDLKGAIEDFTEVVRRDPAYSYVYTNRIIARYRLRDYDGVVSDYEEICTQPKVLALTSDLMPEKMIAECYARCGLAKQKLGDSVAAIESFNRAIRLAPNSPHYYHYRGVAKQKAGDVEGAMKDFDQEKQVPPKR